ncbi:MAG TPA: hypothetical protein VHL56_06165 [Candidatus Limnocylindrales bacterium]|nr:hypothetical protein [Candidatus Limnocylindrales bacterium]
MIRSARSSIGRPALFPIVALLAAACSTAPAPSPGATGAPASPAPSQGPTITPAPSASTAAALILRVTSEGGFIGPSATLATIPTVSVYANGEILTPGPVAAVYPAPLLPGVTVTNVGPKGAEAIVAAIRAAGLDKPFSGDPGVGNPDSGETVFTVTLDGTTTITRLHLGGGGPGLPGGLGGSPDPARDAAEQLLEQLEDTTQTWGSTPVVSAYVPTAYRVFVAPGAPSNDGATDLPAVAWPLATPLDTFGTPAVPDRGIAGLRQGVVFGADAATLGPVLQAASQVTAFESGGKPYTLYVRPLLPDEVPAKG